MRKLASKIVKKEFLSTIEETLGEDGWTWKKVGVGVVIFLMPFGPAALAAYIVGKHIRKNNATILSGRHQEETLRTDRTDS